MPNSVLSKQKETTGSADTRCCSVLKQTCGLFGKPVIFWQHYLQIQKNFFFFAQRNTSWQTEVLMYLSKFSLLNEFRWNKAYITGMFSFASYSQIFTTFCLKIFFSTVHSHLVHFIHFLIVFLFAFFFLFVLYLDYILVWETICWFSARKICTTRTFGNIPPPILLQILFVWLLSS